MFYVQYSQIESSSLYMDKLLLLNLTDSTPHPVKCGYRQSDTSLRSYHSQVTDLELISVTRSEFASSAAHEEGGSRFH